MLGLPENTALNKPLHKKDFYKKFDISNSDKKIFDNDIQKTTIANQISPDRINVSAGEKHKAIFIMHITLKNKECDKKNLQLLSKIPQSMVFVLEHQGTAKLAVTYNGKVFTTEWQPIEEINIPIVGLNIDTVWENIILHISGTTIMGERTLDEQIQNDEQRKKIEQQIERLEKQARAEKQPKKKWDLLDKVEMLKTELENKNF